MMEQWENLPKTQHSIGLRCLRWLTANNDAPLAAELKLIAGLTVKIAEPLARYTSMKIGGPADYFIEVENDAALANLLGVLSRHQENFCLLGNGSNVLISDRGVRGAVIHLAGEFKQAQWREEDETARLNVGAACAVAQLVRQAARKGYSGLEFAEGIPGSVGGALFMNAGAFGSEFEKVVDQVEAMTPRGEPLHLARAQMTFSYRDSHLPEGTIITRVGLSIAQTRICRGNFESARARRQTKKQPAFRFPQFRFDVSQSAGRLRRPADRGRRFEGQAHRPSADFRASCQLHRQSRRRQGGRRAKVNGAGAQRSAQTIRRRASRRGEALGRLVGELNH